MQICGLPLFQLTQKKYNQWFENEKIEDFIVSAAYILIWTKQDCCSVIFWLTFQSLSNHMSLGFKEF